MSCTWTSKSANGADCTADHGVWEPNSAHLVLSLVAMTHPDQVNFFRTRLQRCLTLLGNGASTPRCRHHGLKGLRSSADGRGVDRRIPTALSILRQAGRKSARAEPCPAYDEKYRKRGAISLPRRCRRRRKARRVAESPDYRAAGFAAPRRSLRVQR